MEIFLIIVFITIAWGIYKAFGSEPINQSGTVSNNATLREATSQKGKDTFNGGVILLGVGVFFLCSWRMCSGDSEESKADNHETVNQSTNTNIGIDNSVVNSLTYNRNILERYPFQMTFGSSRKAEADNYYIQGRSQNNSVTATIHYDPSDNQIRNIDFQLAGLSLHPAKSDFQILLDFTDKYDPNFATYFNRNSKGIFVNEDEFVDEGKFVNRSKGFAFELGGDVAYNNMALKQHPEQRTQILDAGNFLSVNVWNLSKPSGAVDMINSGATVEK